MKTSARLALSSLLVVPALLAAGCGGDDVPDGAVAAVDGSPITASQLDTFVRRVRTSFETQRRAFPKAGTPEYQSLRTQAVAYLVQRAINDAEAAGRGIEISDADVDARIEQLKRRFFDGDQERLDRQLKEQGYTLPAFRDDVRAEIVSERLVAQVTGEIKVTDTEARAYYEENKRQYRATSYGDVAAQIKSQLRQAKRDDNVAEWASDLRDDYEGKVVYAAGYEPPDLTPREPERPTGGYNGGGHNGNGNS